MYNSRGLRSGRGGAKKGHSFFGNQYTKITKYARKKKAQRGSRKALNRDYFQGLGEVRARTSIRLGRGFGKRFVKRVKATNAFTREFRTRNQSRISKAYSGVGGRVSFSINTPLYAGTSIRHSSWGIKSPHKQAEKLR